jgi:hypothetical protein
MASRDGSLRDSSLSRRSFLGRTAAAAAGGALGLFSCRPAVDTAPPSAAGPVSSGRDYVYWNNLFETILRGFIVNARRTSDTFAVCDYRNGLILRNFVSGSGKTCDSVTRILPALAARLISPEGSRGIEVEGRVWNVDEIFLSALAHGTDPQDKDFWGYANPADSDQRQVESSIVAWSLWLTADRMMERFTPAQRRNIQSWLASCTRVPVRSNNWALFTAVNHAARLSLSDRWPEFSGDPAFFREDIAAIDRMHQGDGWYHDSTDGQDYDYYNFWVFASHTLYWDTMAGDKFPDLRETFRPRVRSFLESVPYFFGANGSHILFGRSLIYRWAVLTPLVLSWRAGLWPHSPGLLRRICNLNLSFLWESGAWDPGNEKLRETLTPLSNPEVSEGYINNGHPYWGMQAFHAMALGREDQFWTAEEEPLPVEKADYARVIEAPGILLAGCRRTGQAQVWQSRVSKKYPNKYYNFSYSSHFPWNVGQVDGLVPPDCCLSFTGAGSSYGRRTGDYTGRVVSPRQLAWEWSTRVGETEVRVESTVIVDGELQWLAHKVSFGGPTPLTAAESTYALGLDETEKSETRSGQVWEYGSAGAEGRAVFIRSILGFTDHTPLQGFCGREDLNVFYPRGLTAGVSALLQPGSHTLAAAVYASPSPLSVEELLRLTGRPPEELAAFAGCKL